MGFMEMKLIDISDEIELKNGKGNPSGWSQQEIWHDNKIIGWLESGGIFIEHDDYCSKTIRETKKRTRGIIYKYEPKQA